MTKVFYLDSEKNDQKTIEYPDSSYCILKPSKDEMNETPSMTYCKGVSSARKLSPADIERNMRQFSLFAIRVLRNASNKGHNEYRKRAKREMTLSELSDSALYKLYSFDACVNKDSVFHVQGLDIVVRDDRIADLLNRLQERHRNVILLKYYAKWTDQKIADLYSVRRQSIQYQRKSVLKKMRQWLKEGQSNGK